MGSSAKTDYGTLDGVRLLAEKIKDFWKRRGVNVTLGINQQFAGKDRNRSVYVLSSDIGLRPQFRTAHIGIPVKDGDSFYAVSA